MKKEPLKHWHEFIIAAIEDGRQAVEQNPQSPEERKILMDRLDNNNLAIKAAIQVMELRNILKERYTIIQAASMLNLSRNGVYSRLGIYGFTPRDLTNNANATDCELLLLTNRLDLQKTIKRILLGKEGSTQEILNIKSLSEINHEPATRNSDDSYIDWL